MTGHLSSGGKPKSKSKKYRGKIKTCIITTLCGSRFVIFIILTGISYDVTVTISF